MTIDGPTSTQRWVSLSRFAGHTLFDIVNITIVNQDTESMFVHSFWYIFIFFKKVIAV